MLDKHWHDNHFGGLLEHRHLEELVVFGGLWEIPARPPHQPCAGRKYLDWDGGKVWRLIDLNSSTLKRIIFKSIVLAEPDFGQVPKAQSNAERFEVYFHHLYRCARLETLEIQEAVPPDHFPVGAFVREVFGRLRHLNLSSICDDDKTQFDYEEYGECLARALTQARGGV